MVLFVYSHHLGLRKLTLLNILLSGEEDVVSTIPAQRLVFLVKHLIGCLQSDLKSLGLRAEITKTLTFVLPGIRELYGSHWEDSMQILSATFKATHGGEEGLPLLVSSLRLFARLKSMAESEDGNDDLQDAWSERKTEIFNEVASTIREFGKTYRPLKSGFPLTRNRLLNHIPPTSGCRRRSPRTSHQCYPNRATRGCQWGFPAFDGPQSGSTANCLYNSPPLYSSSPRTGVL